ncbi:uncharacterized protein LOC106658799 [Trichogramma pretiosum]|uniref:uncharacterized protein LOC106658799 n=1 Tax=Trichogramma pretiosum TaxID=7493 RepID=UPI0006C9D0B2|nr:uncharacterized protein LOC106658799 [Trichogramma pretiosum]XP_014236406.1 uncharacterized protein LOC106658799 [Trichogramma pretiosum]
MNEPRRSQRIRSTVSGRSQGNRESFLAEIRKPKIDFYDFSNLFDNNQSNILSDKEDELWALREVLSSGRQNLIEWLFEVKTLELNGPIDSYGTIIHIAKEMGLSSIVDLFFKKYTGRNYVNNLGLSLFDIACQCNTEAMFKLIDNERDPKVEDDAIEEELKKKFEKIFLNEELKLWALKKLLNEAHTKTFNSSLNIYRDSLNQTLIDLAKEMKFNISQSEQSLFDIAYQTDNIEEFNKFIDKKRNLKIKDDDIKKEFKKKNQKYSLEYRT